MGRYDDGGYYSWAFAPSCKWEFPTWKEFNKKKGW